MRQIDLIEASKVSLLVTKTNKRLAELQEEGALIVAVDNFGFSKNHDNVDNRLYSKILYDIHEV